NVTGVQTCALPILDTIFMALLINIFTVILGVRIKVLKGFLVGAILNLIINIYFLLIVVINIGNLSISVLTINQFKNPLFYLGILTVGIYVFYTEKRNYKTAITIVVVVFIYKLISSLLAPLLSIS